MALVFTADTHSGDHRAINLHSHSHGKRKPILRWFDIGVDARGFCPVTLSARLAVPPDTRQAPPLRDATYGR